MKIYEITSKFSKTFLEKQVWFHGTKSTFDSFDQNHGADGHAKEGPGFYLTTSIDDARTYGDIIKKFNIKINKLVSLTGKASQIEAETLMRNAPNLEDTLTDWGENPREAFRSALFSILKYQETPKEVFEQIWYDFYRNDHTKWLQNMVNFGYTGFAVQRESAIHFICFDPTALTEIKDNSQ